MKSKKTTEVKVESFGPIPSLRELRQFFEKAESESPTPKDAAKQLKERYKSFRKTHDFKVGDLVTWKPGLRNRIRPQMGQPAIVTEVLESPTISDSNGPGHLSFREPLDLVLGILDRVGDLLCFHYDSRRFQHFKDGSETK